MSAHRRRGVAMSEEKARTLIEQVMGIPRLRTVLEPSDKGEKVRLRLQYEGRNLYANSKRDLESILIAWNLS